jgi:hypothetical protein
MKIKMAQCAHSQRRNHANKVVLMSRKNMKTMAKADKNFIATKKKGHKWFL